MAMLSSAHSLKGVSPLSSGNASPYNPAFQNLVYLVILVIALSALVAVWRHLPRQYGIYATLVMVVCTSDPARDYPLLAFDRYMLTLFPLWMVAAAWLSRRRLLAPVLLISVVLLCFNAFEFSRWVFIA